MDLFFAMSLSDFFDKLIQFLVLTAVSFVLITIGTSMFRFFMMMNRAQEDVEFAGHFRMLLARRISNVKLSSFPFCLAFIRPILSDGTEPDETMLARIRDAADTGLRSEEDFAGLYGGMTAVVVDTEPETFEIALKRIWPGLLAAAGADVKLLCGCAVYPDDGTTSGDLLEKAEESMARAPETETGMVLPEYELEEDRDVGPTSAEDEEEWEEHLHRGIDPVTHVFTPERSASVMRKYLAANRREYELALFMIGLNNLGHVEEVLGEEAGHHLRWGVARALKKNLREDDILGCYDNDHFAILLICPNDHAAAVAARIRSVVHDVRVPWQGRVLKTSANIGVSLSPEHGRTIPRLFRAVSSAYEKAEGRGGSMCVVFGQQH